MDNVKLEIEALEKAFGYTFDEAVEWIRGNIAEYDSVFVCDFNRLLTGDALANQYGVIYA